MIEFVLEIALMLWITEQEIDNSVLPEQIEIVEEIEMSPEESFELFLKELDENLNK